jgi:hypothetical protein
MNKAKYWGLYNQELLVHTNPEEVIEEYVDQMDEITEELLVKVGELIVYGYVPMKISSFSPSICLDRLIEDLDEEYGNPNGDPFTATEAMKKAETKFLTVVKKEYTPWACECNGEKHVVNLLQWVKENRPDLLEKENA